MYEEILVDKVVCSELFKMSDYKKMLKSKTL
ncbi:hypothetical protein CLNEO_16550 [Anaerotignum neopropionicum]|uniref:Uncharacterized protein n=1 Tax=Anaerotignum neopropionicum TaxID=36847 RepID=A0A136WEY6_9FIRM|nr:hypothetical protein CLNEO_16550 [Anaerotignum neopropionicum]